MKLETWDVFQMGDGQNPKTSGYGMLLPDGQALLIKGVGGRTGWTVVKEEVPDNAEHLGIPLSHLHHEPAFAFRAVKAALT